MGLLLHCCYPLLTAFSPTAVTATTATVVMPLPLLLSLLLLLPLSLLLLLLLLSFHTPQVDHRPTHLVPLRPQRLFPPTPLLPPRPLLTPPRHHQAPRPIAPRSSGRLHRQDLRNGRRSASAECAERAAPGGAGGTGEPRPGAEKRRVCVGYFTGGRIQAVLVVWQFYYH